MSKEDSQPAEAKAEVVDGDNSTARTNLSADSIEVTARTRINRYPTRGNYERATIEAILDEAMVCHVGFAVDGQPYVIPTIHARDGQRVFIHGSPLSRMLRTAATGVPLCLTVTLHDGIVLARSAFHHSMNYRSVVVLGTAREVTETAAKLAAMRALVDHLMPGRWEDARQPTAGEIAATIILELLDGGLGEGPHRRPARRGGRLRVAGLGGSGAVDADAGSADSRQSAARGNRASGLCAALACGWNRLSIGLQLRRSHSNRQG
jgi:uncharacterized protein